MNPNSHTSAPHSFGGDEAIERARILCSEVVGFDKPWALAIMRGLLGRIAELKAAKPGGPSDEEALAHDASEAIVAADREKQRADRAIELLKSCLGCDLIYDAATEGLQTYAEQEANGKTVKDFVNEFLTQQSDATDCSSPGDTNGK